MTIKIRKPNKRMLEYWLDESETGEIIPIKMPYKYVIESFCDMVGAGKAYSAGKNVEWKCSDTWDYWIKMCKGKRIMNAESEYLVEKLIWNLKEMGEQSFYSWYHQSKKFLERCYLDGSLKNIDNDCNNVCNISM